MKQNRGKQFEKVAREQLEKAGYFVLRLQDPMGGFAGVSNPCDLVAYNGFALYLIECKAVHGKALNFKSHIRPNQLSGMCAALEKQENIYAGFLIWFIDYDRIIYISAKSVEHARAIGVKSIYADTAAGLEIPATKKRVLLVPDFSNKELM